MKWIKITKKTSLEKGKYICYVPKCKRYNEHWDIYYWDGSNFIDNGYIGRGQAVEASHYILMEKPTISKKNQKTLPLIENLLDEIELPEDVKIVDGLKQYQLKF